MKIHRLKLDVEYCDDILNDIKTFEVRKNDRDFKVGDLIIFDPVDLFGKFNDEVEHEISNEIFVIKYILSNCLYGLQKGYVVLGIVRYDKSNFTILNRSDKNEIG